MKIIIKAAVFALLFSVPSFAQVVKEGSFSTEIKQKKQLNYLLHAPEDINSKKPLIEDL